MKYLIQITIIIISSRVLAMNASSSSTRKISNSLYTAEKIFCIDDPAIIKEIEENLKDKKIEKKDKYKIYQEYTKSDSKIELLARLAYAETLAARCPEMNNEVTDVITTVISNRVKIRKNDVKSVVFEYNQFASSLNVYKGSFFKDFLCPKGDLWKLALTKATAAFESETPPTDTVNYFLYMHDSRWTSPPWNLKEDSTLIKNKKTRSCIRAFVNPGYKNVRW